jgi:hypothetical protein
MAQFKHHWTDYFLSPPARLPLSSVLTALYAACFDVMEIVLTPAPFSIATGVYVAVTAFSDEVRLRTS